MQDHHQHQGTCHLLKNSQFPWVVVRWHCLQLQPEGMMRSYAVGMLQQCHALLLRQTCRWLAACGLYLAQLEDVLLAVNDLQAAFLGELGNVPSVKETVLIHRLPMLWQPRAHHRKGIISQRRRFVDLYCPLLTCCSHDLHCSAFKSTSPLNTLRFM